MRKESSFKSDPPLRTQIGVCIFLIIRANELFRQGEEDYRRTETGVVKGERVLINKRNPEFI